MSGKEGNLDHKQQDALNKFKEAIRDVKMDDMTDRYLLRWLRARSFDVGKAEKMLRDSISWRKAQKVDTILTDWTPPEVLVKYYPGGHYGFDKEGYPVAFDTSGTVDMKGIAQSAKRADVVRYETYHVEYARKHIFPAQSKKMGRPIDQVTLIYDMKGIGLKHMWKPGKRSSKEDNYPESLRVCYVVNGKCGCCDVLYVAVVAPRIFPMLYGIIKIFLNDDTKQKIKILGGNWKEELLKHIDADQLPVYWGGTATDPVDGNPYCSSQICMGGEVPKKYYASKMNEEHLENFTKTVIARGKTFQLEIEVEQIGSLLRWQIYSEGNDLGFGVYFRKTSQKQKLADMEPIVPVGRIDCHLIPEEGQHTCDKLGIYVFHMDNTYSWLRSKTVQHLIELLPPAQENLNVDE